MILSFPHGAMIFVCILLVFHKSISVTSPLQTLVELTGGKWVTVHKQSEHFGSDDEPAAIFVPHARPYKVAGDPTQLV